MPQKLYREWTALFCSGQPIFEVAEVPVLEEQEPSPEQILEEERQQLLDEGDFSEYRVSEIVDCVGWLRGLSRADCKFSRK